MAKLISILIKQTGGGRMPTNSSRKRRCLHIVKLFFPLPPSSQKHAAAASAFCLSSKKNSLFAMRVFNFASPPAQLCFPHGKKYNILRLRCGTPTNICRENLPLPEKEGRGAPACLKGDPPPQLLCKSSRIFLCFLPPFLFPTKRILWHGGEKSSCCGIKKEGK